MGMITTEEEGTYYLEDQTSSVKIDISKADTHIGLFTEGCIVLAQGEVDNETNIFHVHSMAFPPAEERLTSLRAMASMDLTKVIGFAPQDSVRLQKLEHAAEDAMFVVLSDVHLDRPDVMVKLRRIFDGFREMPPKLFIFIGNFMSRPLASGSRDVPEYRKNFRKLANLLREFPTLSDGNSRFIFVPGADDPGTAGALPRAPLPRFFAQPVIDALGEDNVDFTTNPCRIRYYTQEIVVMRHNLLNQMRRACILPPQQSEGHAENGEMEEDADSRRTVTEHLAMTIIDQAHLCPLPQTMQPVCWDYDNAMRLYPLPTMVILADHYDQYQHSLEGCTVLNPGSFPTDYSFVVYRPSVITEDGAATTQAEFSRA